MSAVDHNMFQRFRDAIHDVRTLIPDIDTRLVDSNTSRELRNWLDKDTPSLPWALDYPSVTPDEWFFVTTLYGEMTLAGQRTHIRKYFPTLFVNEAGRDIRNFHPGLSRYDGLRSDWMRRRLCKMAEILRDRDLSMEQYVQWLRSLTHHASSSNPTPELDAIVRDHRASGWKTLSVFIRDCVGGTCFPIDSRVAKELKLRGLPENERLLVSLSLAVGVNPRQIARMFYEAGGESVAPFDLPLPVREHRRSHPAVDMEGLDVNHYVDNEDEYVTWVKSHAAGYVVNCERVPSSKYLILHKASCGSINSARRTNYTTGQYSKMCADIQEELHLLAVRLGGSLHPCGMCKP